VLLSPLPSQVYQTCCIDPKFPFNPYVPHGAINPRLLEGASMEWTYFEGTYINALRLNSGDRYELVPITHHRFTQQTQAQIHNTRRNVVRRSPNSIVRSGIPIDLSIGKVNQWRTSSECSSLACFSPLPESEQSFANSWDRRYREDINDGWD
jgi:hypothetical protein